MRLLGRPCTTDTPDRDTRRPTAHARRRRQPVDLRVVVEHRVECLRHQPHDLGVVEVAGHSDHHVLGPIPAAVVTVNGVALQCVDRFDGAENRPAQRRVTEQRLGESIVHDIAGIVFVHRDLFEDDAAFRVDVSGAHDRRRHHVGDDVDRQRQIVVEHPRVEAGVLLRREGVHLAADRIERRRDLQRVCGAWCP